MSSVIDINRYPATAELLAAAEMEFAKGATSVVLVKGTEVRMIGLAREASEQALARKIADQWLKNPDVLKDLAASLEEKPKEWE
jgi:hypothetical protein